MKFNVPSPVDTTPSTSSRRIVRTLYRHLYKWCQRTDPRIPLTSFLPPIYLRSPSEIEPYHLEMLHTKSQNDDDPSVQFSRRHLPAATQYQVNALVVPVHNSEQLRGFIRSIFRINSYLPVEPDFQKKRVDNAFDALKNLNELSSNQLRLLEEQRRDRTGVVYHIGQVVRHKGHRWRGVIAGWETKPISEVPTSLTQKNYGVDNEPSSSLSVVYQVIVDLGDAHQMQHPQQRDLNDEGYYEMRHSEMELETNPLLLRIRNDMVNQNFATFGRSSYIPSPLLAYQYPGDDCEREVPITEADSLADEMINSVQSIAQQLATIASSDASLRDLEKRFRSIAEGHILVPLLLQSPDSHTSQVTKVARHLDELVTALEDWEEAYLARKQRRDSLESQTQAIRFRVGDIVQHKVFGYQGVITGWDPRPVVDVSAWDGVQQLIEEEGKDPNQLPFYHVIRHADEDQFNAHPQRYVCQDNLEPSFGSQELRVDFAEPGWRWDDGAGRYEPPAVVDFKFHPIGEEAAALENVIVKMLSVLNRYQLQGLKTAPAFSLSNLMTLLQSCPSLADANRLHQAMREIRLAHADLEVRWKMNDVLHETLSSDSDDDDTILAQIVRLDPNYAEAWNKKATYEFAVGLYQDSEVSTRRVIELDPQHVPAWNGLGLVQVAKQDWKAAIEAFETSLQLDPWSPVASKLSLCQLMLEREHESDDKNA